MIEKESLTDTKNLSGPSPNDSKYTKIQVFNLHDPLDTIPLAKQEVEKKFSTNNRKSYTRIITKIPKF